LVAAEAELVGDLLLVDYHPELLERQRPRR
jgi:hypothetical protein